MKALSAAQKFIQSLILAKLQQYIDVLCIFKEVLKAHDMILVQRTMDFDLRH
jgi:hypothetical protein